MKTKYFTIGDGPEFGYMAAELTRRLLHFNGINLITLKDGLARQYKMMGRQYWLKSVLWDFVDADTERIMYFDADILPILPLGDNVMKCEKMFAARLDVAITGERQRAQHSIFSNIRNYFNNGFFIANKSSTRHFDQFANCLDSKVQASCEEQTWMNYVFDDILSILPDSVCWMDSEPKNMFQKPNMIHYTQRGDKLKRYMRGMLENLI